MMENNDVEMKDATEECINKNNEELHPNNSSVEVQPLESDDKLPPSATDQAAKPSELNEPKDGIDSAKNSASELQNPNTKEMSNGLDMPAENVDQDQQLQLGEKTGEDQKMTEKSDLEKTLMEKDEVPAESRVDKASHNEIGVDEEINGRKDKLSDDEVLTRINEGMVNQPKQPQKMVAPTSSLEDGVMVDAPKDSVKGDVPANIATYRNASLGRSLDEQNPATPLQMVLHSSAKSGSYFLEEKMPGNEDGTPEEQAAFMRELERFYRERSTEFKAPRFYGHQLNCLKLWRSVIKLGGYERVTGCKLWRQVGESFHPPKTCTTISWTFRIFYEKALLEYEKRATESGDVQLPIFAGSDPSNVDNELLQGSSFQASGSGRARREASARAMKGWHGRLSDYGEGGEQIMKDKNGNIMKREKSIKSIGSLKQKRPDEVEQPVKAARIEPSKPLVTSVVDVGPPADWVRINVRETKDCYEVYALVPGLLREEVRVQSDPAGRLVITGQPDQPDNPWGITAFKKVVSLPGRIDPLQTSAVVSLHGRLFVRVPFEH